jgi:hypothetical protein
VHAGFRCENLRERNHFESPGVGGRIILRRFLKWIRGIIGWTDLVQDRDTWRSLNAE